MSDIDREVAEKVMGWKSDQGRGLYWWWHDGEANTGYSDDWKACPRWSPSTRIDHAWEVVEQINGENYEFSLEYNAYTDQWLATFFPPEVNPQRASTAPLAICMAALEVVE